MLKSKFLKSFLIQLMFILIISVPVLTAQSIDDAQFNFENGDVQGFTGADLSNDTSLAYAGIGSMKVNCPASGYYEIMVNSPGMTAPGSNIDMYVYLSTGMVASFQPYILDGNWGWNSIWVDKSGNASNTWIKISLPVPAWANVPINRLGVQIFADTVGSINIDSIRLVGIVEVNKTNLGQTLAQASILYDAAVEGDAVGEYIPGSKAILMDAILCAIAVYENESASQQDVDNAKTALETAIIVFENSINELLPPAGLTLSIIAPASMQLTWQSAIADYYIVKRSLTVEGPYDVIVSNTLDITYTDSLIQEKITYYYVVTLVKDGIESKASNIVYGKILGAAQLSDLPLFKTTMNDGWVGGDSGCIETTPNALYPVDQSVTFNNLPSIRLNLVKNGGWWVGLLAGPSWNTYNLEEYYNNGSLEFYIKGSAGNESFNLAFFDKVPERNPVERGVEYPISLFTTVTRNWKLVSIPLKSIIDPVNFQMKSTTFVRFSKDYGAANPVFTVWISDIKVTSPDTEKVYAAVKVNQLGYTTLSEKYAVVSCFDGVYDLSEGTVFSVKDAASNSIVYSSTLKKKTDLDPVVSGEKVFTADFTKVRCEGTYYISVDAPGVPDSYKFKIGNDIYKSLIIDASRYFYLQRSNIELTPQYAGVWARPDYTPSDYAAPLESEPDGARKDVSGGWYDAGDFGKYTNAGAVAVSDMLWAYQLFPSQFTDNQLNIPESNNNIPDILDEIKYELDFLLKLQDIDGGFFHRVQGGNILEDNKRFIMDKRDGLTKLKPSSHTGSAAGMAAHASMIYNAIDADYSKKLLDSAVLAWSYLEANPELVLSLYGPYNDDNDKDDRLYAAAALFKATGDQKYNTYFLTHYQEFSFLFDNPEGGHGWGSPAFTGFFLYFSSYQADRIALNWFKDKYNNWRSIELSRGYNNEWRNTLRSYDYYWGSNMPVLCTSMDLVIGSKLLGLYTTQVINVVRSNLNYVLGINPMGFSYVSGYGDNSMQRTFSGIYNNDGKPGIPVGYLAGGANMYQGSWFSRFSGKCYNDINTEWTTNEHTIYWNSGLVFNAALVNEENNKKAGKIKFVRPSLEKMFLKTGESTQINLTVIGDDGNKVDITDAVITYQSARPSIASVDASGTVTALDNGISMITVTVSYGSQVVSGKTIVLVLRHHR